MTNITTSTKLDHIFSDPIFLQMEMQNLRDALFCNLSHHLFNNSGFKIMLDKKHNELTFYFDFSKKGEYLWRIFTVYNDGKTFEIIPTDNHKEFIPMFETSSFDDLLFYITNKFINL